MGGTGRGRNNRWIVRGNCPIEELQTELIRLDGGQHLDLSYYLCLLALLYVPQPPTNSLAYVLTNLSLETGSITSA